MTMSAKKKRQQAERDARAQARADLIIRQMQYAGEIFGRAATPGDILATAAALAAGTWRPPGSADVADDLLAARASVDMLSLLLEPLVAAWDQADLRLSEMEARTGLTAGNAVN